MPIQEPLAVRLLTALPGPGWMWVAIWAIVAATRPRILAAVLDLIGADGEAQMLAARDLQPHLVVGATVVIAFVGTWLLWTRVRSVVPAAPATANHSPALDQPVTGVGSILGPLALAALLTAAWELTYSLVSPVVSLVDAPLLFAILVPIATFVWVYGAVLIAIDRLGRSAVPADAFPGDRSLGLRAVGNLALTGFAFFASALLLFVLFVAHGLTDTLIAAGLLFFGVAVFLLSMWRLHRQMVEVKAQHVGEARRLYQEAFVPLRDKPRLEELQNQAGLLGAAAALEARAESILEWPIDERATRWLALIITGVVTGLVIQTLVRLLSGG